LSVVHSTQDASCCIFRSIDATHVTHNRRDVHNIYFDLCIYSIAIYCHISITCAVRDRIFAFTDNAEVYRTDRV